MTEDSKELAEAGSFGMSVHLLSERGVPTSQLVSLSEDMLTSVAKEVAKERHHLIGHIKAFITAPEGTLKLNLIDLALGVDITNRIDAPAIHTGEMKFMAAVVGLSDKRLEEIMEESLDKLKGSFQVHIEEHEHEGHEH